MGCDGHPATPGRGRSHARTIETMPVTATLHQQRLPAVGEVFLSQRTRLNKKTARLRGAVQPSEAQLKNAEPLNLSIGLCSSPVSSALSRCLRTSAACHSGPLERTRSPLTVTRGPWRSIPRRCSGSLPPTLASGPHLRARSAPMALARAVTQCLTTISESPAHRIRLCRRPFTGVWPSESRLRAGSSSTSVPAGGEWYAVPADRMLHLLI